MERHVRTASAPPAARQADAGFSLLEVVVAMMLLALLAVATVPLFTTGMRVSADTATTATATERVNAVLEQLRATPTCGALQNQTLGPFPDARGRSFDVVVTVAGACAARAAMTVTATARRTVGGAARTLATATTIIFVPHGQA
jgi:prepilin-type N-terminal cleavage/methylation domain-containing protein